VSSLPDYLPERLRQLGLRDVSRILTHTNRTVMVSIGSDGTVRIHRGYAWASDRVLRAVVRFLDPRVARRLRREAQRELLAFPAEQYAPSPPRASRPDSRMRTRLGELAVELRSGRPLEIAISRRHLARHDWAEVEHTLLHEMVHQWQAESGLRVDHGPTFRRKAREVGVLPAARREVQTVLRHRRAS